MPLLPWLAHVLLPVAIAWSLVSVCLVRLGRPASPACWTMVLAGLVAAYAGDRWRDRQLPVRRRRLLLGLSLLGTLAMAWAGWREPWRLPPLLLAAGLVAAYPLCRRWAPAKLLAVTAGWVLVCVVLPAAEDGVWPWPWRTAPPALAGQVALLIAPATALYDFKDRHRDAAEGTRSLVLVLGSAATRAICLLLTGAAALVAFLAGPRVLLLAALGLMLLCGAPRLLHRPLLGPMAIDLVLCLPGLVLLGG